MLLGSVLHQYFSRHVSMNSFVADRPALADARRRDDLAPRRRGEGGAVNASDAARHAPPIAAGGRRRLLSRVGASAPQASTCSRRCAGSRARSPTSRASATRCVRATSRSASPRQPSLISRRRRSRAGARGAAPPRLVQRVFGLLGPNGALPIHLTEYARERPAATTATARCRASSTCCCTGSACSSTAPGRGRSRSVSLDRPGRRADRSTTSARWSAIGVPTREARRARRLPPSSTSPAGSRARPAMPTACRPGAAALRRAGRASSSSAATGCRWPDERSRLARDGERGARPRRRARRAASGTCSTSSGIVIGPLRLGALRRYAARRRPRSTQLQALVRQFVGFEFAWDLRLILHARRRAAWSSARRARPASGCSGRTAGCAAARGRARRRRRRSGDERREHPRARRCAGVGGGRPASPGQRGEEPRGG